MRIFLSKIVSVQLKSAFFSPAALIHKFKTAQSKNSKQLQNTNRIFYKLMGEEVAGRREFIEKNAKFVVNLDV